MSSRWIPFGRIARAHGVHGALRICSYGGEPRLLEPGRRVRLWHRQQAPWVSRIVLVRAVHAAVLVQLEGLTAREQAKPWAGGRLELDADELPREQGTFFLFELHGASLHAPDGRRLGTVRRVVENAGQDLLVVGTESGEALMPLVPETFVAFNRQAHALTIDPIPGLLDAPEE